MESYQIIKNIIKEVIDLKEKVLNNEKIINDLNEIANIIIKAFKEGNRLYLCGNGGSAADAQHIAAEFTCKFKHLRNPLPAEALHVNTSYLTAVANDIGYEYSFSRYLEAFAKKGDILIALSTSCKSENVLNAVKTALKLNLLTIVFCGMDTSLIPNDVYKIISIPSNNTPRIQEIHITLLHIIAEITERYFLNN